MKIAIKTYGCAANIADTETITGILTTNGHQITTETEADIIIFNSCAVKGPTENRIINAIKQTPKTKKTIIIGCLPKINTERLHNETQINGIAGPSIGENIIELVNRVSSNKENTIIQQQTPKEKPSLTLPKINTNPIISIIPINFGCLGSCAYCAVVFARGKLQSYNIPEIIQRIKTDLTTENICEFWITSQDTAAYGREIGKNLAELLHTIGKVEGEFKVRVGMMTPNMITDMQKELIEAYKNPKIFKFLHFPVQSGDNQVLKKMRRFYTTNEFKASITAFREAIPEVTLSTDIIVGFPGETKQAFENTLQLLKEIKPDITNVSKFFARPKTLAAEIKEGIVPPEEIKQRSTTITTLVKQLSLEKNMQWKNWSGEILVDEKGKVKDSWIGRNFAYKPIVIKSTQNLLGKTVHVKIIKVTETYLIGEIDD
ncbi:MAG: tRNA (N(6)-L-threonylcarbamoyladenosine(37)-C(2))-methylthiotransferase [Nitrososphaerota archaeon]|uniref:tRNA (N(6)-L-threonylcarbamoyladenosine(37)-C(2))- methylthiotransferase n=1 Tax=Candidatus Bathycorpusculum sp. TaxID=2994959 RepID=UPI002838E047|nr:tRNA (N(6)-L-threonylcarbamoyladenosine(37)-C(2))-methylthiotransferase [Candidatus Termiticorpusculum sp.]MCL2291969.1 tRNA (N(6)-L-threonylcarbamoyladenosine(37)-C(2))-methylthiotransferase [Candidatus Termiticorpusculum sp.]MDR0460837.1 tRNA (N(6)-L-threonylcarbamoyladenosine(37)-C(2))-methylthiotransferase [Nitrososphaerota archaeon]